MDGSEVGTIIVAAAIAAVAVMLGAPLERQEFVRFWAGARSSAVVWTSLAVVHGLAGALVGGASVSLTDARDLNGVGWALSGLASGLAAEAILRAGLRGEPQGSVSGPLTLLARIEDRVFAWAEQRCRRRVDALLKEMTGPGLMRLTRCTGPHVRAGTLADPATLAVLYDQCAVLILYETGRVADPSELPALPVPRWVAPACTREGAEDWLRNETQRRICDARWVSEGHTDASMLETWLRS